MAQGNIKSEPKCSVRGAISSRYCRSLYSLERVEVIARWRARATIAEKESDRQGGGYRVEESVPEEGRWKDTKESTRERQTEETRVKAKQNWREIERNGTRDATRV